MDDENTWEYKRRLSAQERINQWFLDILAGREKSSGVEFSKAMDFLETCQDISFAADDKCIEVFAKVPGAAQKQPVWRISKAKLPVIPIYDLNEIYKAGGSSGRAPTTRTVPLPTGGGLRAGATEEIRRNDDKVWAFLLAQLEIGGRNRERKGSVVLSIIRAIGTADSITKQRKITNY